MTNNLNTWHNAPVRGLGDTAVDGLLSGTVAGLAMAATLAIAGLIAGESLTLILSRFSTKNAEVSLLASVLGHLAASAIYGTIFGLIWHQLSKHVSRLGTVVIGIVYSLLLFAAATLVVLPSVQSPMLDIPVQFGLAHLVYGLTLGALFARSQR